MSQKIQESIGVTTKTKNELRRRKAALANKTGRSVSYDEVLRSLFGW